MSLPAAIFDRLPETSKPRSAEIRTLTPLTVDLGAGAVPAVSMMVGHQHAVGDRVLVIVAKDRRWVVGSSAARPQLATVATVGGGVASVVDDRGRTIPGLPYVGAAPTSGARVALSWGASGGLVIGAVGTTAPPPPPGTVTPVDPDPTPTPPPATTGSVSAAAVEVRTARSGSWRTDGAAGRQAYQGHWTSGSSADNLGYVFFGGALATPGATADPGKATITLTRDRAAGMDAAREVRICTTTADRGGTTPPAVTGAGVVIGAIARGDTRTLPLPDAIAQGLLDGSIGGLVLDHPGTAHYLAVLGAGVSGALQPRATIPYTL